MHLAKTGGNKPPAPRGGRSYSPSAQRSASDKKQSPPTETKVSSAPVAPPPEVVKLGGRSQENPVDSWEDIDDSDISQPLPAPSSVSAPTPGATETESKADSRSTSSSGRSTPKSQELPVVKEPISSSTSASSTPDLAKTERKQPSPSLRGEGGAVGRGSKHSSQPPPPKKEDEKDNVNIVFIGHVGQCAIHVVLLRCVYIHCMCTLVCTLVYSIL